MRLQGVPWWCSRRFWLYVVLLFVGFKWVSPPAPGPPVLVLAELGGSLLGVVMLVYLLLWLRVKARGGVGRVRS